MATGGTAVCSISDDHLRLLLETPVSGASPLGRMLADRQSMRDLEAPTDILPFIGRPVKLPELNKLNVARISTYPLFSEII